MKKIFEIQQNNRDYLCSLIWDAPNGYILEIGEPTRTKLQNAKLWPMLRDLSKQIEYHGFKLTEEEWKDFCTATLKQQKFVPNIDGSGFVVVGGRTSTMSKREFSELIDIIYMVGDKLGVEWSEDSLKIRREHEEW